MKFILLDTGVLSLVSNPKGSDRALRCSEWLKAVTFDEDVQVLVPEIADYELRRELVRARRARGIATLDGLAEQIGYLPVTTEVWRRAADLWARARNEGQPGASDTALDADMLLAAQAQLVTKAGHQAIIATTNVKHFEWAADAQLWEDIKP